MGGPEDQGSTMATKDGIVTGPPGPLSREPITGRGKWMVLLAALLGWLFDGFEMGLFPVIAIPALQDLLGYAGQKVPPDVQTTIERWNSLAIAGFLVGAATGGVLFGWLGDRLGRVRAMTLSILTYALCSGLGGFATSAWQIVGVRFLAALGMGGEWSLGVALIMEVWGERSRALLAGLIGAAANFGYLLVALLSLGLGTFKVGLMDLGLPSAWVEWRLLMVLGTLPALLTFFIMWLVPESERWAEEKKTGRTSAWEGRDLVGVLLGAAACWVILYLWIADLAWTTRLAGTIGCFLLVGLGYLYPIWRYLQRSDISSGFKGKTIRTMLLAACVSGVPLLATWGSIQRGPNLGHILSSGMKGAKEYTQLWSSIGAILGSVGGALLAGSGGRRLAYIFLCLASLGSCWLFFKTTTAFDIYFLFTATLAGAATAAFYGWLPLYLPELFPTRVRATGQGFGFNFGRILAAMGALQTGAIMRLFENEGRTAAQNLQDACAWLSLIYVVGLGIIWLAPETHGKPLPE
jgi:MFS family permease